jgi:hypothetical protein
VHGFPGQVHRERRLSKDLVGERVDRGAQRVGVDDMVDEAEPLGVLGVDRLSREQQVCCATFPDQPRQAGGAAKVRDGADANFGMAKTSTADGNTHRTPQRAQVRRRTRRR